MSNAKFRVLKGADRHYYYSLVSSNGEKILSGEGYTTRQNCLNGIESVRTNAGIDSRYNRYNSAGNYTFNLEAANGEIIGRSENYVSEAGRENGINAVKRDAAVAMIQEEE